MKELWILIFLALVILFFCSGFNQKRETFGCDYNIFTSQEYCYEQEGRDPAVGLMPWIQDIQGGQP